MTQFANDDFTGTDETSLIAHTSTSGHTWVYSGIGATVSPGSPPRIMSNKVSAISPSGDHVVYYLAVAPSAPEYTVSCTVVYGSKGTDLIGVCLGLAASSVRDATSYGYLWHISPQTTGLRLRRYDGTTPTNIATPSGSFTDGASYRLTIGRASGGVITGKIQRLSDNYWLNNANTWGATEVAAATVTDTTYTIAGRPGITVYANTPYSTIDDFSADESGGGPQTLTPSLFTNANTFYSPTLTYDQTLTPGLYSNTNTFYAATVTLDGGAQTLTPGLFSNTNAFYAATVARVPGFLTPVLKNNTGTVLASESGVVCNVYNATTGALVVRKTGLTSSAAGIVSVTDAAMAAGTTYAYEIVLTGARRLPVAAA